MPLNVDHKSCCWSKALLYYADATHLYSKQTLLAWANDRWYFCWDCPSSLWVVYYRCSGDFVWIKNLNPPQSMSLVGSCAFLPTIYSEYMRYIWFIDSARSFDHRNLGVPLNSLSLGWFCWYNVQQYFMGYVPFPVLDVWGGDTWPTVSLRCHCVQRRLDVC